MKSIVPALLLVCVLAPAARSKSPAAAPGSRPPVEKSSGTRLQLTVSFLEFASRIKLGDQTLALALDGKAEKHPVGVEGSLKGFSIRTVSRPVKVDGKAGGFWFEMSVLDPAGREVGYVSATVPEAPPPGASIATKLAGRGAGEELALVITRP